MHEAHRRRRASWLGGEETMRESGGSLTVGGVRMSKRQTAVAVLLVLGAGGCVGTHRQTIACKLTTLIIPEAVGAVGGAVGVDQYEKGPSNGEKAAGAAAGFAAGGVVGLIAGHYICREEKETPPPAPPPEPEPAPAPLEHGTKIAEIKAPHFAFDQSRLTAEGRARADEAVRILTEHPDARVDVDGYTDSIGSDAYNHKLSERRARTVADYLTKHGISA